MTNHPEATLIYVDAVNNALIDPAQADAVRPYLTKVCPECSTATDMMPVAELAAHIIIDGNVVIACEGYWVVNPNVVGIDSPNWSDGGCDHIDVDDVAKVCRDCGQPMSDEQADAASERRAGCMK